MLSIGVLALALVFLHRELEGLTRDALVEYVRHIPLFALLLSIGFAASSYLVLTAYDAVALRYVGHRMPYRQSAKTAFMAYAVGHNVGFVALTGGTIRLRMYSLAGLSATQVARIIIFVTLTFGLGASGLLGLALLLMPATHTAVMNVPPGLVNIAGAILVAVPVVYLATVLLNRGTPTFGSWRASLPSPAIAFTQLAISVADLTFAAATLYILLEPELHIGFLPFLGVYLLAMGAGIVSSVPGGVGVFEAVLIALLPQVSATALLATIIVYRLIYYVGPLILALLLLVTHELGRHRQTLSHGVETAGDWLSGIAPPLVGVAVFLSGIVLLVSGAAPGIESRLHLIAKGIPLPVVELSHMAGSAIGVGLLILARGLMRRLRSAYVVALGALLFGAVVSFAKGLDYEEASILLVIAAVLFVSRREFYRLGSVATESLPVRWTVAILIVIGFSFWIGLLSYRHVEYTDQLWWQFAFQASAPRMLRASLLAAIVIVAFALWTTLRSSPHRILPESPPDENDRILAVLAGATDSTANVVLFGDKRLLWSTDHRAFIMYQVCGRSWIAMGGPVGPTECHEDLVWAFRELVDRYDGRPVFYQIFEQSLALYVDLGLTLAKLGEDGRVPLGNFSLQGGHRADLRQVVNRATKSGASFEVVPRAKVTSILPELRAVSDNWLSDKATAEKGFSLGSFSDEYIAHFDCAVVRVDGAIVAFANLWPAPAGGELSVDLMRFNKNAPKNIMDYLFVQSMLWGASNGYQWFCLGMAPLSGMEQRSLAPLWHKVGHLIYAHGESFYNFEGLRSYKEKFDPEWRPKYLACSGGLLDLPRALFDLSRLVSGSVLKTLRK